MLLELSSVSKRWPTMFPKHVIFSWLWLLRMAAPWDYSIVLLFHVIKEWLGCCAWLRIGAVLLFLSYHVTKGWPIDQVTLLVLVCSFVWLRLLFQCIKGRRWVVVFLTPLFPLFHHYYSTQPIMSSPAYTSFPFSYKEDACAQDVVESMEQVGGLASLCLK